MLINKWNLWNKKDCGTGVKSICKTLECACFEWKMILLFVQIRDTICINFPHLEGPSPKIGEQRMGRRALNCSPLDSCWAQKLVQLYPPMHEGRHLKLIRGNIRTWNHFSVEASPMLDCQSSLCGDMQLGKIMCMCAHIWTRVWHFMSSSVTLILNGKIWHYINMGKLCLLRPQEGRIP